MSSPDEACLKCGYLRQPWERECPRCARWAKMRCDLCDRIGVVGECDSCHRDLCEVCAVREDSRVFCRECHETTRAAASEPPPARLLHDRQSAVSGSAHDLLPFHVRHSAGLWDSVVRAFVFIRESVRMCLRDKDLLVPSLLSLATSVVFVGLLLGLLWVTGLVNTVTDEASESKLLGASIGVGVAFCIYLISYFYTAMTVHLVDSHLSGRDAQLRAAFADARQNVLALVSLAVVSTLVSIITSAMRRRGRDGVGGFVGAAVDRVWTVATFILLPIVILEDVSLGRAVSRARSLHGRNLVPIAVGEVAVSLVTGVLGFLVVVLVVAGVAAIAVVVGPAAAIPAAAAAVLLFAGVVAFSHYLRTAYYTCLYLWAAAREEAGDTARAPAPLAAALT